MVLPPGALDSCTLGAHPMIRKGGFRAILLGTGRIPPRCACLECTSTAGEVGTRTLQVTTADSKCISCPRWRHRKRSNLTLIGVGRDTACDRYINKNMKNYITNRKNQISQLIYCIPSYLQVRWIVLPFSMNELVIAIKTRTFLQVGDLTKFQNQIILILRILYLCCLNQDRWLGLRLFPLDFDRGIAVVCLRCGIAGCVLGRYSS